MAAPLTTTAVLAAVGDLVEDVVVLLHEDVNLASDTASTVIRRRGGSAANVVAVGCAEGGRARFIGQIGDDHVGTWLYAELHDAGAEMAVRRHGRSGTVIALVDRHGERTMLTDRATCTELADPDPSWLDGVASLHVPLYSLSVEPLATATTTLAGWAHDRGIRISIDTSSAAVLLALGRDAVVRRVRALRPAVVLANELEAAVLGSALDPANLGGAAVVVKNGPGPAVLLRSGHAPVEVPAVALDEVRDTTGAGDAFAAGLLLALDAGADLVGAVRHAHEVAARHLVSGSRCR